jgi:hypothetical protein
MSWIDFLGFAAALSVLASFCMTTIVALRTVALLSNVLFILYGLLAHIYPVFFLHTVLLPINLVKLHRIHTQGRERARLGSKWHGLNSFPLASEQLRDRRR